MMEATLTRTTGVRPSRMETVATTNRTMEMEARPSRTMEATPSQTIEKSKTSPTSPVSRSVMKIQDLSVSRTGNARQVKLLALNFDQGDIPDSLWVTDNTYYSDLNAELNQTWRSEHPTPIILEQIFGPRPRWRLPEENTKIDQSIDELYAVDASGEFTLALVRTPAKDFPILLESPSSNATSIGDVILPTLKGKKIIPGLISFISETEENRALRYDHERAKDFPLLLESPSSNNASIDDVVLSTMGGKKTTPGLISFISEMEDIRALEYDYERFRKSSDFPTIFYIVEEQKDPQSFELRDTANISASSFLQIPYTLSNSLLDEAPNLRVLSLECIHLIRAFRHSIISLVESVQSGATLDEREIGLSIRLLNSLDRFNQSFKRISDLSTIDMVFLKDIQESLDRTFHGLCIEHPGAVAIRQSFETYQRCAYHDLRHCCKEFGLQIDLEAHSAARRNMLSCSIDLELHSDDKSDGTDSSTSDEEVLLLNDNFYEMKISDASPLADNQTPRPDSPLSLNQDAESNPTLSASSNAPSTPRVDPYETQSSERSVPRIQSSHSMIAPTQWFFIDQFGLHRASRLIVRGNLIYEEVPWASLPLNATREDIRTQMSDQHLNQLPIRSYFAQEDTIVAKFKSNRLRQGTHTSGSSDFEAYGVFPEIAAFSSSCLPNLHPHWNGRSMQLRAVVDIPSGTELTICHDLQYIFEPCQIRRDRLWNIFGINCSCQVCSGIQFPVHESDSRRVAVKPIIEARLDQQGQPPTGNMIQRALEILRLEDLYMGQDTLEYDLYMRCLEANNAVLIEQGLMHLIQAHDLARTNVGDCDQRVVHLAKLIDQYRN